MTTLAAGDAAPAFTLLNADSQPVSLADFKGHKVIVYFYPAALTPGCTIEAVDFTASYDQLAEAGFAVVGISPDAPSKLAKFRDQSNLSVTLLSDPNREVLRAYGAFGQKTMYGKVVEGVIRSTFVIDVAKDGTGTVRLAQYNVKATGHVARLKHELGIG